jgi:hypothetical protein
VSPHSPDCTAVCVVGAAQIVLGVPEDLSVHDPYKACDDLAQALGYRNGDALSWQFDGNPDAVLDKVRALAES